MAVDSIFLFMKEIFQILEAKVPVYQQTGLI